MSPVKARIVMQDAYETRFGIFDHIGTKDRPFSSVELHDCENTVEMSTLYDALTEYAEKNYFEVWGLNVKDFLGQPQYIVKLMRTITNEVMAKKKSVLDGIEKSMQQQDKA